MKNNIKLSNLDSVVDQCETYLSYFVGDWCWFLLLHIERVPNPVSFLPGKDRLSLFPCSSNGERILCFHHKKAGHSGDSR